MILSLAVDCVFPFVGKITIRHYYRTAYLTMCQSPSNSWMVASVSRYNNRHKLFERPFFVMRTSVVSQLFA